VPPAPGLVRARIAPGTANLATGPAMTVAQAAAALDVGGATAATLVAGGARCLVTGDMGIGNTTPSAAVIAAFTGRAARDVTGRGTGIDDARLALKTGVVERAVARARGRSPMEVLAEVGGFEIVAIAGFIVGGAAARVPVIVDGVIAAAGLLGAAALAPGVLPFVIAGHRSATSGSSPCSTSGCASARARVAASPCPSCRPPRACSGRWLFSTPRAPPRSEARTEVT